MPLRHAVTAALACWIACSLPARADDADPVNRAKHLLTQHQAEEAYTLLSPLSSARAGDAKFDSVLGQAALESGHIAEAVFALERATTTQPDDPALRISLAKAYRLFGDRDAARDTLEAVRADHPSVATREALDTEQAALDVGETRPPVRGYVQLAWGRDSNANGGPTQDRFTLPVPPPSTVYVVDAANRPISSDYLTLGAGVDLDYALSDGIDLVGGIDASARRLDDVDRLDTDDYGGRIGLDWRTGKERFGLNFQGRRLDVDSQYYRRTNALTGNWIHSLDPQRDVSLYLQYSTLRYNLSTQDANRSLVGGLYAQRFDNTAYTPLLQLGMYGGRSSARDNSLPWLSHRFYGLQLGGSLQLAQDVSLFASGSFERRQYDEDDPSFLARRNDRQQEWRLGLTYSPYRHFSLTPQVSWLRNRSSFGVDTYDRRRIELLLRYTY